MSGQDDSGTIPAPETPPRAASAPADAGRPWGPGGSVPAVMPSRTGLAGAPWKTPSDEPFSPWSPPAASCGVAPRAIEAPPVAAMPLAPPIQFTAGAPAASGAPAPFGAVPPGAPLIDAPPLGSVLATPIESPPLPASAPPSPFAPPIALPSLAATPSAPGPEIECPPVVAAPLAPPVEPSLAPASQGDGRDETRWGLGSFAGACLTSTFVHLVGMIALALWVLPPESTDARSGRPLLCETLPPEVELERQLETLWLDERLEPAVELREASSVALRGSFAEKAIPADVPWLDAPDAIDRFSSPQPWFDGRRDYAPRDGELRARTADGAPGVGRQVVDGYGEALDRITVELLKMLARRKVLVIWCFDQSQSMKDDQDEIRARLERVYAELRLSPAAAGDAVLTAVTSFGQDFLVHTPQPTADLDALRAAIESVPIDPSGEEMMCRAVSRSIFTFRKFADRHQRQMALILVTDESGNAEESDQYLEPTIELALAARCRVFVLGREAVFGYPLAHVRWTDAATGREYLLPVDRGPETAFVEQLQTEGFEPRTDAHPSGFGPWTQSRLAWRTGGVFFLLPSLEDDLHRGEKRRYELEAIAPYQPDWRSRAEILLEAQRSPLESLIHRIVNDLNPHRPQVAEIMDVRRRFPAEPARLARELQESRAKASRYLGALERAIQAVEAHQPARLKEASPRWRANYDLLRAQLVAYAAKVRLYQAALEQAAAKVASTPLLLPDNRRLVAWVVRQRSGLPRDAETEAAIARARQLYLEVLANHPGTPWAARAEWELRRDFAFPGLPEPERLAQIDYTEVAAHDAVGADGADTPTVSAAPGRAVAAGAGAGVGVGIGVGVGGGGGGGGVGAGVGAGVEAGDGWGEQQFPGLELVPEYRLPEAPRRAGEGAGGLNPNNGSGGSNAPPDQPPRL